MMGHMMSNPESQFYQKLKRHLTGFFIQRVENSIGVGTPDLFFSSSHNPSGWPQGWCELKHMTLPKKLSTRIRPPYRPGQYKWLIVARRAGVLVILLIDTDKGIFGFHNKDIQQDYSYNEFHDNGVRFKDINSFADGLHGKKTIKTWLQTL